LRFYAWKTPVERAVRGIVLLFVLSSRNYLDDPKGAADGGRKWLKSTKARLTALSVKKSAPLKDM